MATALDDDARRQLRADLLFGKVDVSIDKVAPRTIFGMHAIYGRCFGVNRYDDFLALLHEERERIVRAKPWAKSKAKEMLMSDIKHGNVSIIPLANDAKAVFSMHDKFQDYLFKNVRNNLKRLRESMSDNANYSTFDSEALKRDRLLYPIDVVDPLTGKPRWDGSDAQKLLTSDIMNKRHDCSSRRELWLSRPEYQTFTLDVFRKHVEQGCRAAKNRFRNDQKKSTTANGGSTIHYR